MTKHRSSKYNLHLLPIGGDRLIILKEKTDMHSVRVSASAFGVRNGRKFAVTEIAEGIARVTRLKDDFTRERPASKYNFHRLEVGEQIEVPMSRGARNAALIFGKRNGKVLKTEKASDETLLVTRVQ